ncbi:hypothetical protein [Gemmatimonas sp.]|uniref:deazapurine DNA modification protein DpdA family protein n=1 Tax=Gemmatimonas sp. TaxID=1962908 RepID=UPI003565E8F0
MFGAWRTTSSEYVDACHRYIDEVGMMDWAAPQDWMCEPFITAKTGLTIEDHQRRTLDNFHLLRRMAPGVPFIPVLQGWEQADYERHMGMYEADGIDLTAEPTVGIGSVCRRESTDEIGAICKMVSDAGIGLHGFGVKGAGVRGYGRYMKSADSMAWSRRGRNIRPCPHSSAASCGNCRPHALAWRQRIVDKISAQASS